MVYNSRGLHQGPHLIENGNADMVTIIGVLKANAGLEAES